MRLLLLCAIVCTLAMGCEQASMRYLPSNTMGIDEIKAIAQDTTHYRALIFTNPYCYGCREEMQEILATIEAMDTSLWRVYYLIVEDITDSAHWQEVGADMIDIGAEPSQIYHWRQPAEGYGYSEVVASFRSTYPITVADGLTPWELMVDTNNYIDLIRCFESKDADSCWYQPQGLYPTEVTSHTDYSTPSDGYAIIHTARPAANPMVVIEQ